MDLYRRPAVAASSPDTQWTYRIDYTPRSADTFTFRYLHDRSILTPDFFTNGAALPGFDTQQGGPSELGQGSWTHIFTSHLLNEFRAAETRLNYLLPAHVRHAKQSALHGPTSSSTPRPKTRT